MKGEKREIGKDRVGGKKGDKVQKKGEEEKCVIGVSEGKRRREGRKT